MTTQANPMSATNEPPSRPRLPYWLGIIFPLVISASICFAVTFVLNRLILPIVVTLAATAGIGLIAGFAVRQTLRNRARLIQGATALAALIIGLLMLGLMTNGQTGLGGFYSAAGPNWGGLALVALAALTAWLSLRAWRPGWRTRPGLRERLANQWQAFKSRIRTAWESSRPYRALNWTNERLESARAWSLRDDAPSVAPAPTPAQPASPRHVPGRALIQRFKESFQRAPADSPAKKREPKILPRVTFTGAIEHRCPYCLELVEPNDPRGVRVCEICHTYHHADCWAITGMCQVPHHHTEIKVPD